MYKGGLGQAAFFLHRLSGWAVFAYLLLHTVSIGSVILGEGAYNTIHRLYEHPLFRIGLLAVAGGVAFHALNGVRIILMDFTAWAVRVQRQLFVGVVALTGAFVLVAIWYNLPRLLSNS